MFFIVPIGHDELTLRALPFATMGAMAILLVAFVLTWGSIRKPDDGAGRRSEPAHPVEAAIEKEALDLAAGLADGEAAADLAAQLAGGREARPKEIPGGGASRGTPFARRFGFVPSRPGVGLLTHMFLHDGIVPLVIGLVFLWAVAVKLESLWSRPVFAGVFVVGGIAAALVHAAVTSDPDAPLVGSSGAVAALMGAFLVRLGRSKVYYAYFVWLGFKPRVGTFDAPAYITPLLWLVTVLGAQLAAMAIGSSIGHVSLAAWAGGFAFGCAAAGAFRLLRFEERVLRRPPEVAVAPEKLPLVAFQERARPERARPERPAAIAAAITGIDRFAIRLAGLDGGAFEIPAHQVRVWAVGRVARVAPGDEAGLEGAGLRAPAVLLALVAGGGEGAGDKRLVLVDAARLRYAELLDEPAATPKEAFFRLTSKLGAALPGAAFAGDRARLRAGELPEHATIRELLDHVAKADALLRR